MSSNLSIVRESVAATHRLARGVSVADPKEGGLSLNTATDQAREKAIQSVAQSAAIAVQNGVEMLRNVSTMEVVAIGVATAEWIAEPENVLYEQIIQNSMDQISAATEAMGVIATTAAGMITAFDVAE